MKLRPYESKWAADIRKASAEHNRILIVGPTGSGKTVVAANLIRGYYRARERVLFVAHRQELIRQCVARLISAGIPEHEIGVLCGSVADLPERPGALVQVASVQTLSRRGDPCGDVVVVDEAHHAAAPAYRRVLALARRVFGLTATPCRLDGKPLGDIFDVMVEGPTAEDLIAEGWLSRPRIFSVPPELRPSLAGVRTRGGDYDAKELGAAATKRKLVGSIADHWLLLGRGLPTVAYAVNVAHGKAILRALRKVKARAEILTASTPTAERVDMLRSFEAGELEVIVNCQVLTEGWDCPAARCCVMARPTKSLVLWLQVVGRFMRPGAVAPIILDHAGNWARHGSSEDAREWSLNERIAARSGASPEKSCPECGNCVPVGVRVCQCGHEWWGPADPIPDEVLGQLVEVSGERECECGCGRRFRTRPFEVARGGGKYATRACVYRAQGQLPERACACGCGKMFRPKPSAVALGKGKYATMGCYNRVLGQLPERACACGCGKMFRPKPYEVARGKGKYATRACVYRARSSSATAAPEASPPRTPAPGRPPTSSPKPPRPSPRRG